MATIPGTYITRIESGNDSIDTIVNVLLTPTIGLYRQIPINYETGTVIGQRSVRFTYSNWCEAYPVEIYLNGGQTRLADSNYTADYVMGTVEMGIDLSPGDSVMATYFFDYFPYSVLEGFIYRSIDTANNAGNGATTHYTIKDLPSYYLGIITDLVISMCMEKLIIEYDLWKGRLIFAIGNNAIYEGGGDIVGQLETVKRNSEERAYKAIDNPKFRARNALAKPTDRYYEALLLGSGARYRNGEISYGPLRGAKFNRLMGNLPRR